MEEMKFYSEEEMLDKHVGKIETQGGTEKQE